MSFASLWLGVVCTVISQDNLPNCWTVTFITFSIQMFYWKSWACAVIPLFNLQEDITQRYLVEHKGLWIRIKVQQSVTVPQPGSYFDAPKPGFYEKGWTIMLQFDGQLPFFMIWQTSNRYQWTFDPEQTAHIAQSKQLKSSRGALMNLSLW